MKKIIQLIYLVFIILLISCVKDSYFNVGFDSQVNKDSNGLLNAEISETDERIFLNGFIRLSEGELEIIMENSTGEVVFSKTVIAPVELPICEKFEARQGNWKLLYASRDGIGKIELRLHN